MRVNGRLATIRFGGLVLCLLLHTGSSAAQSGPALLPDIVEEISHIQIVNRQQQEILRFSTTHWNQGAGPLQVRGATETGECPPDLRDQGSLCTFAKQELLDAVGNVVDSVDAGISIFHIEHNHWHQADVARFELHAGAISGPIVAANTKVTFCLIDVDSDPLFVDRRSERVYWDCGGVFQGISVGWGDEYHQSTPLQDMNITGIPEGEYYLTHVANPARNWTESNYDNNDAWVKLYISRKGANPEVRVLSESPCPVTDPHSPDYQVLCGNTSNK
jgi:hypothetical protein